MGLYPLPQTPTPNPISRGDPLGRPVKDIEAIPLKRDRRWVAERITELAQDPRPLGAEKISGQDKYRIRQGRYRILYTIEDQDLVVQVVKVGHRQDVYRQVFQG